METLDLILLVIVGWLLGMLAGPIGERIRRHYSAADLKRACFTELNELRYTMAALVHLLHSRLGTLDHSILEWLHPIEFEYEGPDKVPGQVEAWQQLMAMSPSDLAAAMAVRKAGSPGMNVKKYSVSFLEARLPDLAILPVSVQQALHQVRNQLDLFNQDVSFLQSQFALTFSAGLGPENYTRVQENLVNGYETSALRARSIADAITRLLESYS